MVKALPSWFPCQGHLPAQGQGKQEEEEEKQGALRQQAPQTLSLPHSEFLEQDHIKNDLHQGAVLP